MKGREWADQGGEGCVVEMGRKGGGEMDGEPCYMVQEAALNGAGEQSRGQGHVRGLRSWSVAGCAVPVRRIVGPLSHRRHPTARHMAHEGRMALRAGAYHAFTPAPLRS